MEESGIYVASGYVEGETEAEALARWHSQLEAYKIAVEKRLALLPLIEQAAKDGVEAINGLGYIGLATIKMDGIGADMTPKLRIYAKTQLYHYNDIVGLSDQVLAAVEAVVKDKLPYRKLYASGHPPSESMGRGSGVTIGFMFER